MNAPQVWLSRRARIQKTGVPQHHEIPQHRRGNNGQPRKMPQHIQIERRKTQTARNDSRMREKKNSAEQQPAARQPDASIFVVCAQEDDEAQPQQRHRIKERDREHRGIEEKIAGHNVQR